MGAPGSRRRSRAPIALAAALGLLFLLAPAAQAALPTFKEEITKAGTNSFKGPWGLAFDHSGNLFVADAEAKVLDAFGPTGAFTAQVGAGEFPGAEGIGYTRSVAASASTGDLYVGESGPEEVFVFKPKGGGAYELIQKRKFAFFLYDAFDSSTGSHANYLYTTAGRHKVKAVAATGAEGKLQPGEEELAPPPEEFAMFGGPTGTNEGGLAVDGATATLIVANAEKRTVDLYDTDTPSSSEAPTFLKAIKGTETPTGAESFEPVAVAVDESNGLIYALDAAHDVVDVFSQAGHYEGQLEKSAGGVFSFTSPRGIAVQNAPVASEGRVYVTDGTHVDVFNPGKPAPSKFKLTVTKSGSGSGTVTSTPSGINCGTGASCEHEFEEGVEVTLGQAASSGSEFKEWSGACTGSGTCKVTMSAAKTVTATFAKIPRTLEVKTGGEGELACKFNGGSAGPCASPQLDGTAVEVIATAKFGSEFKEWSGGSGSAAPCSGTVAITCSFTIEANSTLTATFSHAAKPKFKLTVSKTGTGSGTVTSTPSGINCGTGASCEHEFEEGVEVELHQTASPGSEFKEWTGACTGSGTCKVTMSEATEVGAVFEPIPTPEHKLTITISGEGEVSADTGTISGCTPSGGPNCEGTYPEGTHVKLTETPGPGQEFAGWQTLQCDESTASSCEVTIGSGAEGIGASFKPKAKPKFKLTVAKTGGGVGTITSTPAGINCGSGSGCEHEYEEGEEVELHETPTTGAFKEWGGACSGSGTCKVTMSAAKSVSAKFVRSYKLTVSKTGTGQGTITSTPSGISCGTGAGCEHEYEEGTQVELHQSAEPGSEFKEWGGACSGNGTCKVTLSEAKSVSAKFEPTPKPKFELSLTKSGGGSGTVTSSPPGIDCGILCEAQYEEGTEVTLSQSAEPGSEFKEWSGACSGSGACKVTISEAKSVNARFEVKPKPKFKLSVSKIGGGGGTVTSTPAGISCGTECEHEYTEGTSVELSHSASPGSEFKEWAGACSGSGTCKVTMSAAKSVSAKFAKRYKLTVSKLGGGAGTISSTPAGISCGSTCSHEYEEGTEVELHETPSTGTFKEWGGACSGSGTCKVTMSAAKSVTARFVKSYELSVEGLGAGSGTISSTPSGISCGSSCEHPYEEGTEVQLHATPSPGSVFLKWSGDCSGTGACKVTMSAARSVGAKFVKEFKLTVSKSGAGQGTVSSTPAGIDCGSECEAQYEEATTVTLAHSASSGSEFVEWGGACTGTGACKVKMSEAKAVNARFEPVPTPRYSLKIELAGSGSGLVSCDGGACAATYAKGTEVSLNATALSGSAFTGWSGGGCSGTAPCKAKIDSDTTIVAHFEASPLAPPPPIEAQGEAIAASSAVVQAGSASLRLTCPGPGKCAGTLELFAKLPSGAANRKRHGLKSGTLIATASFALSPGSTQTLAVKIANAQAKQLLAQGRTLKAQLVGTGVQGRTVRLRGAKGKRA